jgi:hypothetical protein
LISIVISKCTKSEQDLFEVPPTQTSVAYGYWEQKGLTSALTDQGPYEVTVSWAGDDYIDLANTYLFVEAQIVDDDNTELEGGTSNKSCSDFVHSHSYPMSFDVFSCLVYRRLVF